MKFQGACEALKGHTFDCSDHHQADRYATTLKKLSEHVGATFKNGGDVRASIEVEAKFWIPLPPAPTAPNDPDHPTPEEKLDQHLHNKRLDSLIKHETILDANIQSLYSLVIGQCTDLIQTKLKQQNNWATVHDKQDGITLLTLIKTVIHWFEDQKFLPLALYNAKLNLYAFRQGNLSNDDYLRKFNNLADVATLYDGELYNSTILEIILNADHPGTQCAALSAD